jgi:hypothetical protein
MNLVSRWIEITFVLILMFLVLSRSSGFSSITRSIGSTYVESVKALQGR